MGVKVNLVGNLYGKIRVIEESEKRGKNGSIYWNCLCECGNEKLIRQDALLNGSTKSCYKCSVNKFYKENDYMICETTKSEKILFDEKHYDIIKKYSWFLSLGYATTNINGKQIKMHRLIMKAEKNQIIDHINRDPLDNRESNLRFATNSQNNMNKQKQQGNYTSKYKGVYWDKTRNTWVSKIKINNRNIYIKSFKNEKEAAKAYNIKAREIFGQFAKPNKI